MFQPTKKWVNKGNLSSFELENFFKFGACVISARKAKQLDATTMFTYSHANTALGQSERAYYLSYFINLNDVQNLPTTLKTSPHIMWLNFFISIFITAVTIDTEFETFKSRYSCP